MVLELEKKRKMLQGVCAPVCAIVYLAEKKVIRWMPRANGVHVVSDAWTKDLLQRVHSVPVGYNAETHYLLNTAETHTNYSSRPTCGSVNTPTKHGYSSSPTAGTAVLTPRHGLQQAAPETLRGRVLLKKRLKRRRWGTLFFADFLERRRGVWPLLFMTWPSKGAR